MHDEIRVSPDGRNVVIRNLRKINPGYDGQAEWRGTNGAYWTDKQVEGWAVLNRPHEVYLVKKGEYEDAFTVAVYTDKGDAEKFIEEARKHSSDRIDVGESAIFHPHGSCD